MTHHELLQLWLDPAVTGVNRRGCVDRLEPHADLDAALAGVSSPWVRSLDGEWELGLAAGIGAAAEPTDVVAVPGTWVLQGHGAPIYLNVIMPFGGHPPTVPAENPVGWYRRTFTLPARWRSRRTLLRVNGANAGAAVWVNDRFVGIGTDRHLPSTFEISAHLRRGENRVAIAVPTWSAATWIEDQDQWWAPGLTRGVELFSVPQVALDDVATVPGLDADGTTGTLEYDVSIDPATAPNGYTVELRVDRADGDRADDAGRARRRPLATTGPVAVADWTPDGPGGEQIAGHVWPGPRVTGTLTVPGIAPWHHERPHRYRATIALRDPAGALVDVRTRLVGFRRVELADRALLINGRPVLVNGVNHHDDHPDRGAAVTPADVRADLELMKRHHVNAVRTSHYPKAEWFYDLCDELGLYVIDEANVESHGRWRAIAHDPAYLSAFVERGARMVRRDRSRTCVIAWSLGNESGYGPNHDAMAAYIRRIDPSRPLHYEGAFWGDLAAHNPVTDITCPMYASVERIVQWSHDGRDRRPLILCEYAHAMGQAGGLDSYWEVFGTVEGLQGGFVWEWADHALRKHGPDTLTTEGSAWLAYGGDFGEPRHDGRFVCDGLVSADREPHPLLAELAALTQPVAATVVGGGRARVALRIENRRWFTDLGDVRCRWELVRAGRRIAGGRLELPAIAPRGSATVELPIDGDAGGALTLRVTPTAASRRPWMGDGWAVADIALDLGRAPTPPPRAPARRDARRTTVAVGHETLHLGGLELPWPKLSVWRAPTDNDDPPGEWRPEPSPHQRWLAQGLHELTVYDVAVAPVRGGGMTRTTRHRTATGAVIEHRQRVTPGDAGLDLVDTFHVDATLHDLPRLGVRWSLDAAFDQLQWSGLGPGSSYPDRRAATRHGVWSAVIGEEHCPFVIPQEYGLHLDCDWFAIGDGARRLVAAGDGGRSRFAFSALPHSVEDLAAATHAHLLPRRRGTHVHVDVAHRGLGTAACGPDTAPRWIVGGGRYRLAWSLGVH